jgi:hypothetical protein
VGSVRQRQNLMRGASDEQFLSGYANALAAVASIDLPRVRLESGEIPFEALMARLPPGNFTRVGDEFHLDRERLCNDHGNLPKVGK